MATYDFTVRAEDETGAFSDRAFSIQVRNNLVDRLLAINGTNAYSSIDGVNWTERTGKGGIWCDNILGKWIVIQNATTYRVSEDTINWEENLQFRLKNDPPVYSEVEEGSEEEPELLQPAGELYDLPFTIQAKSLKTFNGRTYAVAVINANMTGMVYTDDLINWYAVDKYNSEVATNNLFGITGLDIDIRNYSNLEIHNGRFVIYNNTLRGFIVSEDNFESFQTVIPSNSTILAWGYRGQHGRNYIFTISSVNGVLFINHQNRATDQVNQSTAAGGTWAVVRNYIWFTIELNNISIPVNNFREWYVKHRNTKNGGDITSTTNAVPLSKRSYTYINGSMIFSTIVSSAILTSPLSATIVNKTSATGNRFDELIKSKGVMYTLYNGSLRNLDDVGTITTPTTNGLPTSGLVSIAAL